MQAHLTRTEEEKVKLATEIVAYLNEVLKLDPETLTKLCEQRVPCSPELSEHPTTQMGVASDGSTAVGLLGILNGLVGIKPNQWGYIVAAFEDDTIVQFQVDHNGIVP